MLTLPELNGDLKIEAREPTREEIARAVALQRGHGLAPKFPASTAMSQRLTYIGFDGQAHLNLGSGVNPIPGAVNVDVQAFPGVDLTFDFTQPWPIGDLSYDKVTMFHCLEHVPVEQALALVREAYRVLRWSGVFIAEVPDIDGMAKELVAGNYGMLQGAIYGGNDDPRDGHYFGYTASSLALLVHLGGFVRLVTGPGTDYHATQLPTIRVEAVKVARRTKGA